MKYIPLLAMFIAIACRSSKSINEQFVAEINNYGLEGLDTLVDIGCGFGYNDRIISSKFQQLHFILEDVPNDIWANDLKKALAKNVRNTPFAPTFGTNATIIFGTADSIPLQSGQYKRVLCRIALHEFSNRAKMTTELTRILSITGVLIVVEKIAAFKGDKDKACKQLRLTKEEIISAFSNLQLIDTIRLQPPSDNALVFKFAKKT